MKVTVYGASSAQMSTRFVEQGQQLGRLIAERGWTAVHGGGSHGMMGAVSDGGLDAGGNVTGVIPMFMVERGWLNPRLTDVVIAADMAQRKQLLREGADAIIVMPGGIGTFDEFFEAVTLRQLGQLDAVIVLVNLDGYYDSLLQMLHHAETEGLMRGIKQEYMFNVVADSEQAIALLDKTL